MSMKAFYKFIGSKWFSYPLISWPFFYILWIFIQGGGFDSLVSSSRENESGEAVVEEVVEEDTQDASEDEFDLSIFTVSEEDFQAVTSGDEKEFKDVSSGFLHEKVTDETGKYAILYFVLVLSLSPLKVIFRRNKLISALNRHRRSIGVASFFYAFLHFSIYLVNGLKTLATDITRLYIIAGLVGFSILLVLAATSNNWTQRKLGGRKWKRLHRIVYLAIPLLFYHQAFTGKADVETIREALYWFSPIILLQPVRIYLTFKRKRDKQLKPSHANPA